MFQAGAATLCTDCEPGKSSDAVHKADNCNPCVPGSYQTGTGKTSCALCGSVAGSDKAKKYQDQAGQTGCKNCDDLSTLTGGADNTDNSAIANGAKTDCDGCAAIKGGPNVFLDPSTGQCAWCTAPIFCWYHQKTKFWGLGLGMLQWCMAVGDDLLHV